MRRAHCQLPPGPPVPVGGSSLCVLASPRETAFWIAKCGLKSGSQLEIHVNP